jgi:antitoxin HicB
MAPLNNTTQVFNVSVMKTHPLDYPVNLTPDDGAILVTFPDVPEAITQGEDEDEALLYAIDALETALSFYVDDRKPLPVPSKPKRGQKTVRPSALECAKLGVYQAMTEQGIRKSELARRLGWHMPQVDRLFDLKHASRLDQIEAAARALGRYIEVSVT